MFIDLLIIFVLAFFIIRNIIEIKKSMKDNKKNEKYISWCKVDAITEFIYIIFIICNMF